MTKLVKRGSQINTLMKNAMAIHKQDVFVGHGTSQGIHGPSGLSYVELLKYWYVGVEREHGGRLRQDVRGQFIFNNETKISKDPQIMSIISKWFTAASTGRDTTTQTLDAIGVVLRTKYRATFNVRAGPFMDTESVTPLYETGELAGVTAYRTSKNSTLKES